MTTLRASAVFCGELADDVLGIVVAEEESGEGARLEIQRAKVFDEEDRALRHDTYCLSLHTGATVYGGVSRWRLTPGVLSLELSAEAAETLGVEPGLTIEFDVQATDGLRQWLPRVFEAG